MTPDEYIAMLEANESIAARLSERDDTIANLRASLKILRERHTVQTEELNIVYKRLDNADKAAEIAQGERERNYEEGWSAGVKAITDLFECYKVEDLKFLVKIVQHLPHTAAPGIVYERIANYNAPPF